LPGRWPAARPGGERRRGGGGSGLPGVRRSGRCLRPCRAERRPRLARPRGGGCARRIDRGVRLRGQALVGHRASGAGAHRRAPRRPDARPLGDRRPVLRRCARRALRARGARRPSTLPRVRLGERDGLRRDARRRARGGAGRRGRLSGPDGGAARRGIRLEAIAKADREQDVLASYVRTAFTPGSGRTYSVEEAVGIVGLDSATVRRLWQPLSFSGQGERLYEEDVQALKALKVLLEAGFPEEALLQLTRVYADALGRVAEAEIRLFHFYVHERLKAGGVSGRELVEATNTSGDRMRPLIEPVLLYFHQKGMEQAAREDIVLHVQEEAGFEGTAEVPAQLRAAVLFVDLSSFTPLTEAMGDAAAAEVLA